MQERANALWGHLKANRAAFAIVILLTLSIGILIGTVISVGVKGQEKRSSSDATPLTVPSPRQLSNQFSQIAKILERSLGSGVVVDSKGYIVTNRHVVEKADRIRVRLQDDPPGVQHDARVIGSDQETDRAVIKIDV